MICPDCGRELIPAGGCFYCECGYEVMSLKKLPNTPRSRIRASLRQLWMRSRERAAVLKRAGHKCECCGALSKTRKGGEATLHVHHHEQIDWDKIIGYIQRHLLVEPENLDCLCSDCHAETHEKEDVFR